jgi:hypothetical protein
MRAITHVVGKAIGSSRGARRARRLLVEDAGGTPIFEQPDCVAAGVGGPSSSHRARMPGWTCRWGRGPLGDSQDVSGDVRRRALACARFRPRLRSSACARTARSRVVPSSRVPKLAADDCFARKRCSDGPRPKGSRLSRSAADCAFGVLDQDPSGLVGREAPARVQQVERLEAGRDPEDVCGLGDPDARPELLVP